MITIPDDTKDILKKFISIDEKYTDLSISAGDHAELDDDEKDCPDINSDHKWAAYTVQFGELGDRALMSICDYGLHLPSLDEIRDPARVGPGCAGLGDHDSGLMTSLGGQILHELIHWRYLLKDVADFDDVVEQHEDTDDGENIIIDFEGGESSFMTPDDGYGPVNAHLLVAHGVGDAVNNTDNYRWFAQSKYWAFMCGRCFGPALDNVADGDSARRPPV